MDQLAEGLVKLAMLLILIQLIAAVLGIGMVATGICLIIRARRRRWPQRAAYFIAILAGVLVFFTPTILWMLGNYNIQRQTARAPGIEAQEIRDLPFDVVYVLRDLPHNYERRAVYAPNRGDYELERLPEEEHRALVIEYTNTGETGPSFIQVEQHANSPTYFEDCDREWEPPCHVYLTSPSERAVRAGLSTVRGEEGRPVGSWHIEVEDSLVIQVWLNNGMPGWTTPAGFADSFKPVPKEEFLEGVSREELLEGRYY